MASSSINSAYNHLEDDDPYGLTRDGSERDSRAATRAGDSGSTEPDSKPQILLLGLRRSGKSSIQKVVFQKMSPHETLFLESTQKIMKSDISTNSFVQFQILDFPGQLDFFDPAFDLATLLVQCGAIVFVIDAQDDYTEALTRLNQTIKKALSMNGRVKIEVFIHKVDGLSDDHKVDFQRDIQQQVRDEVGENVVDSNVAFHLTSIYDHSIFEAFSKVIQKLIPQLPTLESLLDYFIQSSRVEKAFLFDVVSKIYITTDSSPVDSAMYELCSDMIDVMIDVSCIYSSDGEPHGLPYDKETSSIIRLNNGTVLYLREMNRYLALVCLVHEDNFDKLGLINYNLDCLREALVSVFKRPSKHGNPQGRARQAMDDARQRRQVA